MNLLEEFRLLRNYDTVIGFCWQQTPLECEHPRRINADELKNINKNSIGINCKRQMRVEVTNHDFENEGGNFIEGDFVGLGIIQTPNWKIECFATLNGKLLGKII